MPADITKHELQVYTADFEELDANKNGVRATLIVVSCGQHWTFTNDSHMFYNVLCHIPHHPNLDS